MTFAGSLIVLVAFVAAASIVLYTLRTGIGPSPSPRSVREVLLAEVPDDFRGVVMELGSGWGHLLLPLARRCPRATIIGYELSPIPFLITRLRVRIFGLRSVQLRRKDFFDESLREATLVVCYLHPGAMDRLARKLADELAPNALILSSTFALPGWEPLRIQRAADLYRTPIYTYRPRDSVRRQSDPITARGT